MDSYTVIYPVIETVMSITFFQCNTNADRGKHSRIWSKHQVYIKHVLKDHVFLNVNRGVHVLSTLPHHLYIRTYFVGLYIRISLYCHTPWTNFNGRKYGLFLGRRKKPLVQNSLVYLAGQFIGITWKCTSQMINFVLCKPVNIYFLRNVCKVRD